MLEIVEIIRKMEQGLTEPYLCTANDDCQYIVKGASTGGKGRIAEWICAHLGRAFGLPIPEFQIVEVPEYLIQDNANYTTNIGHGPVFASKYIPMLQEVNYTIVKSLDEKILRDIFVFDYWVANEDRTLTNLGGNPNLIYAADEKKVFVFDHNNAFDSKFNLLDFKQYHVGRQQWFENQRDLLVIDEYKARMLDALTGYQATVDDIPQEWLACNSVENELLNTMTTRLSSYTDESFWEALQ